MARFAALVSVRLALLFTTLVWADGLPTAKPEEVGSRPSASRGRPRS